ncbi:MAG: HAD-IA family hydrolase [Pseudomonadota bacterium]
MTNSIVLFGSLGAVAETSDIQRTAYNQALAEAGLSWHWDEETYKALLEQSGGRDRLRMLRDATNANIDDRLIERIHARKTELACARIRSEPLAPRPGVAELVEKAIEREFALGFVTTTYRANIDAIGEALGDALPLHMFEVVITRDDVEHAKPHPAAYQQALQRTGRAPAEAIAIEDTMMSVLSAIGAGIETIATPGKYATSQHFFMADHIFGSLADESDRLDGRIERLIFS